MMTLNSLFIKELKQQLTEEVSIWVISALRQDSIVWACLQDPEFSNKAINTFGADPAKWYPANLSLLALEYDGSIETALTDPELLNQASETCETKDMKAGIQEIYDLRLAGLLAINIANRIQSTDSWNESYLDLQDYPDELKRLVLVCLYRLTPDPLYLLRMIMKLEHINGKCNLLLHTVLANPQPIQQQEEILSTLLTDTPIKEINCLLGNLHLQQPEIAVHLSREFIPTHSAPQKGHSYTHITEQVDLLSDLLLQAEINTIAKLPEKTISVQTRALQIVNQIKAGISAQLAGVAIAEGDLDTALKTWQRGGESPSNPSQNRTVPPPDLIVELLEAGYFSDALALIPESDIKDKEIDQIHPSHLIAAAHLAKNEGNSKQAEIYAKQAFQNFEKSDLGSDKKCSVNSYNDRISIRTNRALVKILSDLSLYPEALTAAKWAVIYQPNDVNLLTQYASAQRSTGNPSSAAETLYIAVSLSPNNENLRRELITCLEEAEAWEAALIERCALFDERFAPDSETIWPTKLDQYAIAKVSLLAEQPDRTIEICQSLLRDDEQDGLAHATIGEAFMSLGDTEGALDHLDKATQYSPHQAFSWLALARVLKNSGNTQKALETLRAASHAVPTDPNILLSLAEIYLEQDEYSKALPVLQEAHSLVIDQNLEVNSQTPKYEQIISSQIAPRISLEYGRTLQVLGHHDEARQILSTAYRKYPAYRGLAYSYAKSLLSLKDFTAAIPPLVIAVQAEPDELAPNLDYGLALLEDKTQPQEAVKVLSKTLEIEPTNSIIKALLAEALIESGSPEAAMQTFSKILETELMDDPEWVSRVSHGFGRSALALDKPEIAIASLQDAVRSDPQNPRIFQTLAEAYSRAELTNEAFETAITAKQLAPDDIEILTWFADIALEVKQPMEAIPALIRALQLSPNNAALLIQLGNVQSHVGKDEAAKETYRHILLSENPLAQELLIAAKGLILLGDFVNAIVCLELGLEKLSEPDPEFLRQLAIAYKESQQYEQALATIEYAIALQPDSAELLVLKTDILVVLDRPQAAEASLEHAINLHPENHALHHKVALFYRSTGQVLKALSKAEELITLDFNPLQTSEALAAQALAAELARSLLQHDYAISILTEPSTIETIEEPDSDNRISDPDHYHLKKQAIPYFCLLAEISLEQGEEISAANYLTKAVKLAPDHPRVIALQSRLSLRSGDHDLAEQTFQNALQTVEQNKATIEDTGTLDQSDNSSPYPDSGKFHEQVCNQLAIAEAAIEIKHWEKSIELLECTSRLIPNEPNIYLLLARSLVLRAEYQDFCQSLNAVKNTPGDHVLASEAYQSFIEYLDAAERQSKIVSLERKLDESRLIQHWKIRGNAIFQPNSINLHTFEELAQSPDDLATLISYTSRTKDLINLSKLNKALKESSELQSQHHLLLAQVARSLSNGYRRQEDYEEARLMVEAAIHQAPSEPLYHALKSEIEYKLGEVEVALDSIETALAAWPNEPRWHTLAAKFNNSKGNIAVAISHLKKAAELEPNHLPHHLTLGEILQKNGDYRAAIQTLEYALDLAPDNLDPYLCLAKAHLSLGEYDKAADYAQIAIRKAPNEIKPLLASAEIALQEGNLRKSQKYAKSALNIDPHDPEALQMQAHIIVALGRPEEALDILDQAINLSDKPLNLQLERADLISSIQGSKAALKNLQELALEYPEDPAVLYHLAKSMASVEQYEAAILVAQKALKCNTSTLNPKELSQIHYLVGQLMRKIGQLDQSIYQLSESIRLTPTYLEPYLELGRAHQERRQHAQSLQTYQKAITIAPDDPRPYCQAGLLLKESHDYPGAESMLRRAADLAPDDLSIHRQLGALVALNIVHNRRAIPKA